MAAKPAGSAVMLPAGCSRGLVAELRDALDSCAERQRQLEQSLRVTRRLLRAWDPADSPTREATPGCKTDPEPPSPARAPSPAELRDLQLLNQALEKAARVRRRVPGPGARGRATRRTPAPSRPGLGTAGSKPPRGGRQPAAPGRTAEPSEGDRADPSPAARPVATPAATPTSQAFTLKEKGSLLRLPTAFRTAAAANSRLWAELNSQASGPADAASARAAFLQHMRPATESGVEPNAAEVRRLHKACSVLRLRLAQEQATGQSPGGVGAAGRPGSQHPPDPADPGEPQQEYRHLLLLEGLRDAAGQCLRRLQELRADAAEPWREGTASGGPPRCAGNTQPPWGPQPLAYSSVQELQTLAALLLRVSMLRQQRHLQEVLMAQLLPLLRAQQPTGGPGLELLRAAHSLLCEGGERFVTVLRDEPVD